MKIFKHDKDIKILMIVCVGIELDYDVMKYIANNEFSEYKNNRKVNFRKATHGMEFGVIKIMLAFY